MSLHIVSWNLECRLSRINRKRRGSPEKIFDEIVRYNADVYVFPEAYNQNDTALEKIDQQFTQLGYEWHDVCYDDAGYRPDGQAKNVHMRIASRVPVQKITSYRPGNVRNLIYFCVVDVKTSKTVTIFATHLDERSEHSRLKQAKAIVPILKNAKPFVMIGDFNAMHRSSKAARFLRSNFGAFLSILSLRKSIRHKLRLAREMARGDVLEYIERETGAVDADPSYRPTETPKMRDHTFLPSIRLIDIDHALVSPDVTIESLDIQSHDGGSDHRALSLKIRL